MLDDKIAATDWEATQDELIQQVTRESYLQWLRDTNQQHKDNKTVCLKWCSSFGHKYKRKFDIDYFYLDAIFEFVADIFDNVRTNFK